MMPRATDLCPDRRWESVPAVAEAHGCEEGGLPALGIETEVAVGDRANVADVGRHHGVLDEVGNIILQVLRGISLKTMTSGMAFSSSASPVLGVILDPSSLPCRSSAIFVSSLSHSSLAALALAARASALERHRTSALEASLAVRACAARAESPQMPTSMSLVRPKRRAFTST